jgi:hypothetical protein
VFGLASVLPEKYMGAVMLGNGYSGIAMNVLKAILMVILPGEDKMYESALIFFVLASMILILCSASFTILNKTAYFNYYRELSENGPAGQILAEDSGNDEED